MGESPVLDGIPANSLFETEKSLFRLRKKYSAFEPHDVASKQKEHKDENNNIPVASLRSGILLWCESCHNVQLKWIPAGLGLDTNHLECTKSSGRKRKKQQSSGF